MSKNILEFGYIDNPFTPWIMSHSLPHGFQFAKQLKEYDGTKDPTLHVSNFERAIYFQGVNEVIVCRAFPLTFSVAASRWFYDLPPQSINSWKALKDKFVLHFTSSKRQFKSEFHLEMIKQIKDESLREYITRFINEVIEVRNVEPNLVLYFFVKGLKPGAFAKALAVEKPTPMDDLKARAEKWIRIKEWERAQAAHAAKKEDKGKNQQNPQSRGKEDKA
jgi:hypothetical protein